MWLWVSYAVAGMDDGDAMKNVIAVIAVTGVQQKPVLRCHVMFAIKAVDCVRPVRTGRPTALIASLVFFTKMVVGGRQAPRLQCPAARWL